MSHKVSYKWIRRTQYITSFGLFYKERKVFGMVSDCLEGSELVYLQKQASNPVLDYPSLWKNCYYFVTNVL